MSAQTPTEKLKAFKKAFLKLTTDAANDGVPLQNLILELETEKFRLLCANFERESRELAKAILPASAMPGLDLKRNGN